MNAGFVAVLVVGLVVLASLFARRRGYTGNQRIVLSGIAVVLLVLTLFRGDTAVEAGEVILVVVGSILLISGVVYLRKSG